MYGCTTCTECVLTLNKINYHARFEDPTVVTAMHFHVSLPTRTVQPPLLCWTANQERSKQSNTITLLLSPAGSVWAPSPGLPRAAHCACSLFGLLFQPDDGGGMCAASHQERLPELRKPMNTEQEICYPEKFLIAPGNKLTTFLTHTCTISVSAALTLKARLLSSHPPCQWGCCEWRVSLRPSSNKRRVLL